MGNSPHIGILGGFGPLPTAELYTRLCALIRPRPHILVNSPSISKNAERKLVSLSADKATRDIILNALNYLQNNNMDIIAVPSLTVMSLIQEEGIVDKRFPEWFSAICSAVTNASARRIGIIATQTVLEHSSLVIKLREEGVDIVSAPRIQPVFEEWILSCDDPQKAIAPPSSMLEELRSVFLDASIDTCLLACTEACLFESCFSGLSVCTLNSMTILTGCIVDKIKLEDTRN